MARRSATAGPVAEGTVLWRPSARTRSRAVITRYLSWLRSAKGLAFDGYEDLWRWSVTDLEAFWATIWEFFEIKASRPYSRVLPERKVFGARWFPGAELNYAEHALRRRDEHPAILFRSEDRALRTVTYADLRRQVAAVAASLRRFGVRRGDRVVAYMPNIPEAVVAALAAVSLGATWSSCPPEFGNRSIVDRFRQIEPKVLFAVDGYRYQGKAYDRREALAEIQGQLPTLEATVLLPYLADRPAMDAPRAVHQWEDFVTQGRSGGPVVDLAFEPVPFDHPLWVLYSSGTTGLPKGIVHGHGGAILEHLKALAIHTNIEPEDRFFWFTTTGWMMWNFLVSGLLVGATIVLYDGSPTYPDIRALWRLAEETGMTYFGTSGPYLMGCAKADINPGREFDLGRLWGIGSTGAPLPPEGFRWAYEHVKDDLILGSMSGGTDVHTAFVLSCPLLPVRAGEIQCRGLGAKVEAFDERGQPVIGEVGELVVTEPMPSMPVRFWNDPEMRRYRESYFDVYPGVWRHGDWIKITPEGGCVIYGRSDSTLNRGGVRIGTSEFYRIVEEMPEVLDTLVVDTGELGRDGKLLLFVVLREGVTLDEGLRARIMQKLRQELSPRHAPNEIYAIPEVPRTINGKKLEVPVKRILAGTPVEKAASPDAMSNPHSLRFFVTLAATGAPRKQS